MKKVFFAMWLTASVTSAFAQQNFSAGPVLGVNSAWISDADGLESKIGLVAGGTFTYSDVKNWGIGASLLYSKEGAKFENDDDAKLDFTYLRLPIKGIIFFRDNEDNFRPKVFLGPSFGFLLDAEQEPRGTGDLKDAMNNFDVGLLGGLGFNVRASEATWINVDLGYTYGLTTIIDEEGIFDSDVANRGLQLTVGLLFGI